MHRDDLLPSEFLEWDARFLGCGVARIVEPVDPFATRLPVTLEALRAESVKLVYCSATRPFPDELAVRLGAQPVSRRAVYEAPMDADSFSDAPTGLDTVRAVRSDEARTHDEEFVALALQAGEYSRFNVDPRIPYEKFHEMYSAWIRKSLSGELAEQVLIVSMDNAIAAMVTVYARNKTGQIGLLSVASRYRRRRLGQALVSAAHRWYRQKGCLLARVVTQGENEAACALYESCGYSRESLQYVYHIWL